MSEYTFDTIIDRRNTASLKWDIYKDRDILPLWVADMDFQAPPAVIDALRQQVTHGIFGYTHIPEELPQIIKQRLAENYGWQIAASWLVWLPGLVSGLNIACRAVGNAGDQVVTTVPIYPPFLTAPAFSDRNLITVPLVDDATQWIFDLDHLEKAITPRTKLLLLCTPHNPCGRVFTKEELETLAEICIRRDLIICSDEIHCELILDASKKHLPTATLGSEIAKRTITLMAPSKTFNIPGLGCSFAIIPHQPLRRQFQKAMSGIVPEINCMGLFAGLAAYKNCHKWHHALLEYLRSNRNLVEEKINAMNGLSMRHVEATYLAWIDARETGLADPHAFFEQAGVGLFNGTAFGTPGFLRLNFGCPRTLLEKALGRMAAALKVK